MTCSLARNTMFAVFASPEWLSLTVKFTSDLSPRNIRCARGSDSERLGSANAAVFGKSICTLRRNGGLSTFSVHWFSWLSPSRMMRFWSPSELPSSELACRNAAR